MNSLEQTAKSIGVLLLATVCVVALVTVLVVALDFILLIFLGILFSVFLTKTSQLLNRFIPIGYGWTLALVTSLLLLIVAGGITLLGDKIQERVQSTSKRLDEGTDHLVQRLREHPMAFKAFQRIPFVQKLVLDEQPSGSTETQPTETQPTETQPTETQPTETQPTTGAGQDKTTRAESEQSESDNAESEQANYAQQSRGSGESSKGGTPNYTTSAAKFAGTSAGKVFSILGGILSTSLGLVANIGLIFFVGIFLAVDPTLYRDGFARLFPLDRRHRVADILDRMGSAMFSWLMGRFASMVVTAVGTAVALLVLGVPMAITVGVITGLLTFVPNIGAIAGLVLAILMALPQGVATVGWVVGLYAVVQLLESNVITPLVQQHQTAIPPALLLSFQVIMGAVAGFLGLMVATPFLAVLLVLVEQAWIKDVLGEPASED